MRDTNDWEKTTGHKNIKDMKYAKRAWKRDYSIVPVEVKPETYHNPDDLDRTMKLYCLMVVQVAYQVGKTYYERSQQQGNGKNQTYSRLIWTVDLASKDGGNLVAIFTTHENKMQLFDDDIEVRSNGVFSPGGIFVVERPPYAENLWNGCPVLSLHNPIKMVRLSSNIRLPRFRPMESVDANRHAFVQHEVKVSVMQMRWSDTPCNGLLCDSIGVFAGKKCACFDATQAVGQTILNLDLYLIFPEDVKTKPIATSGFTSKKFTGLLFKGGMVPKDLKTSHIRGNMHAENFVINEVKKLIDFVNQNGGWTTVGMGTRGEKDDEAEKNDENVRKAAKVDSTKLAFHLTLLQPTNANLDLDQYKLDPDVFITKKPEQNDDDSVDSTACVQEQADA